MARGQKLPPPTAFTPGDKLRLASGALILLLGLVLLWRFLPLGLTLQMILVCGAFIGFGVYRLGLGYTRWRTYTRVRTAGTRK